MNKIIKLIICMALSFCMIFMTACEKSVDIPDEYNYDDFSEFINLADYKDVDYTPTETTVTQKEIDAAIKMQLQQYAKTGKKIKSGVAKEDSVANINFVGKIDGKEFEGGSGENYDLDLANSTFIPGFAEEIVGHSVGETFDVNVTFPEDYNSAELAGKPAVFVTTINYLTTKTVPEYNLDFVKKNTEFKSLEEYEKSISEQLKSQKEQNVVYENKEKVLKKIVEDSEVVKYPELEYSSKMALVKEQNKGISDDEAKEILENTMKNELVLYAISKLENIEIDKKEYQQFAANMLQQSGMTADEFKKNNGISFAEYAEKGGLFITFLFDKVMEKVMEYNK